MSEMIGPSIAIVGGGAMGGAWAGRLGGAGFDVAVLDVSRSHVDAIRASGLSVSVAAATDVRAEVLATTDPDDVGARDVIFIFVKGPNTRAAASSLGKIAGGTSQVVSLQNGWGNADTIAEYVEPERIVVGVTYEGATLVEPGRVSNLGHGPTYLGPFLDEGPTVGAQLVADVMGQSGFECHVTNKVRTDVWRKLIHNASCLPVAALTDLRTSQLVEPGDVIDVVDALAAESVAVARAAGHDIDLDERIRVIHDVLGSSGMGVASMLADIHARRRTEIDTINGAVVQAAGDLGVDAPLNRAMVSLVHGMERAWARADPTSVA